MRRWLTLLPMCLLAAARVQAGDWSGLWLTPAQQGQRLLDAGRADEAARAFKDPRRRAYAELKAGHYQDAAKLLAPYKDPTSEYNRGNALAHDGKLEDALSAYHAGLEAAPDDRDLRHNRDLVARALEQQKKKQPPSSSSGGTRPNKAGGGANNARQDSGARSAKAGTKGGNPGKGTARSGTNRKPNGGHASSSGTGSQHDTSTRKSAQTPASGKQTDSSDRAGTAAAPQRSDDEQQAKGDAKAAVAALNRQAAKKPADARAAAEAAGTKSGAHPGDRNADRTKTEGADLAAPEKPKAPNPAQKPESEQALALDQWLRRIPDDAAGLLRRKFLIEHVLRQQQRSAQ